MNQHEGNDPRKRHRDKKANAWFQTRVLMLVIGMLMGVIVATLMKRGGIH